MGLNIQTNVATLEANKSVSRNQNALLGNFSKLSTGFRVNSAADDAAGLAISETMKSQIRSYTVAERNAADGISMAQTAEGALGEVHEVLGRMRELAMQSANGSVDANARGALNSEFLSLNDEINRIRNSTSFNGNQLIGTGGNMGTVGFQVGLGTAGADTISVNFGTFSVTDLSGGINTQAAATGMLANIDTAINQVSNQRATFGTAINRLQVATNNIQTMRLNMTAANSRIRDVDVAEESAKMAKNQVLSQTSVSVMAQANQMPQLALKLLG